MAFMECFSTHRSVIAFLQCLGQIVTVKVRSMCSRCGDCIEATNAKTEIEKGLEYWHSIGRSSK